MNVSFRNLLAVLTVTGFLAGCSGGGDTDGGSAGDENFGGSEYVDDASAGSIDLVLNSSSIAVAGTTGFRVRVTDSAGQPVTRTTISCDTEEGVAIIEPTTGSEMTDSNGQISGIFGCERPGSFQVACRLPIGGNKRDVETLICTGAIPDGFSGFPGAAGGGLGGGGVSVQDPTDPNGSPGGGDLANSVTVESIDIFDVGSDPVFTIDASQLADANGCDGDPTTDDPEPFVENAFSAKIVNDSNQRITVTSYQITIPGVYTSAQLPLNVQVDGNGGNITVNALFTTGNPKVFFGGSEEVQDHIGANTLRLTFRGTSESAGSFSITASTTVNVADVDNCNG